MSRGSRALVGMLVAAALAGCALLPSGGKKRTDKIFLIAPTLEAPAARSGRCGVIQVGVGPTEPGQRGTNMNYTMGDYQLHSFAYARWGAPPARMLQNQMRATLRASGAFAGVLSSPTAAETDYQLELADVSVVQRFTSDEASQLQMGVEIRLYDGDRRHLLASAPLQSTEAAGFDAPSGVEAANRAAAGLLREARDFVLTRCGRDER